MTEEQKATRINKITEMVLRSLEGDFSLRIPPSGQNDEIDILSDAINQLLHVMKENIEFKKQAGAALKDSEEKYRHLELNIPGNVYLYVMHPDGSFSFPYVNEGSRTLFNLSSEDVIRDPSLLTGMIHPDDRERYDASVKHSAKTLQPWRQTLRFIVNGKVRWYDCISHPEVQPNGDILWEGITLEITDHMKALEQLIESRKQLSDIISASPVGIAIYDDSGQCITANNSIAQIAGATQEQILEQNFGEIESWKKSGLLDLAQTTVRTRSTSHNEVSTISSFGKELSLDCHFVPFGKKSLLFMVQDITERKRAEKALRDSEKLLRDILDGSPIPQFIIGMDHRIIMWNKALEEYSGFRAEDVVGTDQQSIPFYKEKRPTMADLLVDGSFEKIPELYSGKYAKSQLVEDAYEATDFFPAIGKQGKWLYFTASAIKDSGGNIVGAVETLEDITERKQAEESLRRLNRELQAISNCNQTMMRVEDEQTLLHEICRIVCEEAGYCMAWVGYVENDEAKAVRPVAWAGVEDQYLANANLTWADTERGCGPTGTAIRSGISTYIQDFQTDPNVAIWRKSALQYGYRSSISLPLKDKNANVFGVLNIYSTELNAFTANEIRLMEELAGDLAFGINVLRTRIAHEQAGEMLKEREEFLSSIVENIPDMIFIKDAKELRFIRFNKAGENLLGYKREDLIGRNDHDFFPWEQAEFFIKNDMEVLKSGKLQDIPEEPIETKSGKRILHTKKIPIRDKNGSPSYLLGISEDITERKQAEEEQTKLQAQLAQAQKMESVGRLAGGVAHDFNNMLGVIIGYTDMAFGQVDPAKPIFANLQHIRKAAEHSADLTRQLLAFARKQTIAPKVLDLNETLESMLKILRRLIGEDIDLTWLPGKSLWPVKVDPSQIDQILANLGVNARDAIAGVGKISIETGNATFDEDYCTSHPECTSGDYVRLAISDNGCGMSKEILEKLFEPFFTTKDLGKGTGLGLATVYGIVKQNNGFISVHSEKGFGSTFNIYLPRYEGKVEEMRKEGPAKPALGHETILLVEDDQAILDMGIMMLEDLGYTILATSRPDDAIRIAKEHTGEIHLLLTDVVMPAMNGRDLAKSLLLLYPPLKCLFMSGYTANVIAHHGILDENINFIQKPFSMHSLAAKLRETLEKKS